MLKGWFVFSCAVITWMFKKLSDWVTFLCSISFPLDTMSYERPIWSCCIVLKQKKKRKKEKFLPSSVLVKSLFCLSHYNNIWLWIEVCSWYWSSVWPDTELMQTELHHLQTLHIMAEVFRRGMKEEVQLDTESVERVFPCLDQLLAFHHAFFAAMKERRQSSGQPPGHGNYLIQQIGDILLRQVGTNLTNYQCGRVQCNNETCL